MVHLKMAPWEFRRVRLWKASFSGSMLIFLGVGHIGTVIICPYPGTVYGRWCLKDVGHVYPDLGDYWPSLTNMFQIGWKLSPSFVVEYPISSGWVKTSMYLHSWGTTRLLYVDYSMHGCYGVCKSGRVFAWATSRLEAHPKSCCALNGRGYETWVDSDLGWFQSTCGEIFDDQK